MTKQREPMTILVIGANGGIGRCAVEAALSEGHHVTALLRDPEKLKLIHANLQVVKGDIRRPESFNQYLEGKDAVISALGEKTDIPTTLYSDGARTLLYAMQEIGIKRAFFISACAIEISPVQPFIVRLATKYIVQKLFGNGYADQRIMEKLIKESDSDYTIVRPPRLNDKPTNGKYRFAINTFLKNCLSISRADVAHFMISNINNKETYRTIVEIAN